MKSIALLVLFVGILAAAEKPNIVFLLADDMTWSDCAPNGSKNVPTPNMQKLAEEGMRFDNMFTSTAMCAPARQMLYTGLFPVRSGAFPNHSKVRTGVKSIVHHLSALGYSVSLEGKHHFGPRASFPFEKRTLQQAIGNGDRPFCHIVASDDPHTPWTTGDASAFDLEKIVVPPYLIDTPATRRLLCNYYAEIANLDETLGTIMRQIDAAGIANNTVLMFNSEQGMTLPFGGKWSCYESGLKTAFLIRWPGTVKPGSATGALAQSVDILPTLVEIAGGDPAAIDTGCADADGFRGFDGRSLLAVLKGKSDSFRDHVFGVHTNLGIINGPLYPIRSVRDVRYKYIRNLNHANSLRNACTKGGIYYVEMFVPLMAAAKKSPEIQTRLDFYQHRPAEELYDLEKDPYELHNLADSPELREIKVRLSGELDKWMRQQGDRGIDTEKNVEPWKPHHKQSK